MLFKRLLVVVLLVLLFWETAPTPWPIDKSDYALVIGHISDPHTGLIKSNQIVTDLERASQEASLIVVTGDITEYHQGSLTEFLQYKDCLKSASVPVLSLPGNHDEPEVFKTLIGPLQWILDINGYRLIGLNTKTRQVDFQFLQSVLETNLPTLVFSHYNTWLLADEERLLKLLEEHRVLAWICGHHHFQSLKRSATGTTIFLQGGWGLIGSYDLICLKNGKVAEVVFR